MRPENILFTLCLRIFLSLFIFGFLSGCTQEHAGEKVFQKKCSQCHGMSGKGLKKLYPPLDKSSFFSDRINELPCLILHGSKRSVDATNTAQKRFMPPIPSVSTSDLIILLDFLQRRWSPQPTEINQSMLEEWLSSCKT